MQAGDHQQMGGAGALEVRGGGLGQVVLRAQQDGLEQRGLLPGQVLGEDPGRPAADLGQQLGQVRLGRGGGGQGGEVRQVSPGLHPGGQPPGEGGVQPCLGELRKGDGALQGVPWGECQGQHRGQPQGKGTGQVPEQLFHLGGGLRHRGGLVHPQHHVAALVQLLGVIHHRALDPGLYVFQVPVGGAAQLPGGGEQGKAQKRGGKAQGRPLQEALAEQKRRAGTGTVHALTDRRDPGPAPGQLGEKPAQSQAQADQGQDLGGVGAGPGRKGQGGEQGKAQQGKGPGHGLFEEQGQGL